MFARTLARTSRALPRAGAPRFASSSASSSRWTQKQLAEFGGVAAVTLGTGYYFLSSSPRVAAAAVEEEAKPKRRLTYAEKMKPRGDGVVRIPYPKKEVEEEEKEEVVEEAAEPLEALESEASQQAAFDPETNTINWDCPCLGGMADGPCGEEFKAAFSCFVFSEAEPKGIECVSKFQNMQDCFRRHPEVYAEELKDEEWEEAERDGAAPETGADLAAAAPGTQEHSG